MATIDDALGDLTSEEQEKVRKVADEMSLDLARRKGVTEVECGECGALVPIGQAEYIDQHEFGGYWRCDRCQDADWHNWHDDDGGEYSDEDGWDDLGDDFYDDWDPDEDDDDLDYWLGECGLQDDGTCLNVGTEECDFECPFRWQAYKDEEE